MKENFTVYDYISINVKKDLEQRYIDCYKNFGWIHIKNSEKTDYYINNNSDPSIAEIKFKRNKDIKDKEELNKLQRKCEKALLTINKLEKIPQALAMSYSLAVGVIALAFLIICVFLIIWNMWFGAIICGAIGLIGCAYPYSIYRNVKNDKEIENKTKIEEQQNIISNAYQEVRKILIENE